MLWEKDCEIQNKYLDQIDFTKYFKECETIEEIRIRLNEDYDDTEFCNNEDLDGCILNYYTDYDLMRYLETRYHFNCRVIYHEDYILPREAKYVEKN